jgi:hypothetical protein
MTENPGTAGVSARREYERRKAKDEARIRAKWGRFGNIAVALSAERHSTAVWRIGADGEERLGATLNTFVGESLQVLHDRRIPRTRANIDHLVITPQGIWVIDSKRYKGRPSLRVEGGFIRPRVEKLVVAGRDKTALVDGMLWQLEQVRSVVTDVPLRGVLCFIDADWPLFGGSFTTRGVDVLWPKKLFSTLRKASLLEPSGSRVDVTATTELLAGHFPVA